MTAWLTLTGFLANPRNWLLIGGLAALAALALWLGAAERADDKANRAIGAAAQREADLTTTLERTENAHAARTAIRDSSSAARYDQCLRTARTPAHCQRFLPGGAADQR